LAMKLAPLFGLLLLPLSAFGQDTAYQALRALGVERDQTLLKSVIEVKGRTGVPQPGAWTVVIDDPKARGGVREIEVSRGKVVSERTPLKGYSGVSTETFMDFKKLNLDSQGAFTLAEEEAKKARVSFDSVDYLLRRDEANGSPLWVLQLLDADQRGVATLTIAADTGTVLSREFKPIVAGDEERATARKPREQKTRSRRVERETVEENRSSGQRKHLGYRIERRFHRIGGSLQEFFTGRRTVDREYRD